MMTQQNKALAFTAGFFAVVLAIVATFACRAIRSEPEAVPTQRIQVNVAEEGSQIVWSHQIEAFLSLREEVLKSLIIAPPSDETFLRQAMAMLSTPYAHSVTGERNVELSQSSSTNAIYLCSDADIITDLKITEKISSPDRKSMIYLFDRPEGSDAKALGYFVVTNQRLTRHSRIFVGCKGSPSLKTIRWTDRETVEVVSEFMGGTDTERIRINE